MIQDTPIDPSVVSTLSAAGCVWAEDEAALLTEAASGSPERLADLVARRCAGEPLELLTGWAPFCGLRVAVAPGVFIPRRRTELLAQTAAGLADKASRRHSRTTRVLDLCCGSGAIALTICRQVPAAHAVAADVSDTAVACARDNLRGCDCEVLQGDLFAALPEGAGPFDVIVANVPYVPSALIATLPAEARDHEPRESLDGGADGLDLQRRLFAEARPWLETGGCILVETSRHQLSKSESIAEQLGYRTRVVSSDELGATVVVARMA